jgi:hypothetical protein
MGMPEIDAMNRDPADGAGAAAGAILGDLDAEATVPPSAEGIEHLSHQPIIARTLSPVPRTSGKRAWQQQALARCQLLRAQWVLADTAATERERGARDAVAAEFCTLLEDAEKACAAKLSSPVAWMTGLQVERVWANVHMAEIVLFETLPSREAASYQKWVVEEAGVELAAGNPVLTSLVRSDPAPRVTGRDLAAAMRTAYSSSTSSHVRVRSFRNTIYFASCVTALAVASLVLVGYLAPGAIPMCNTAATRCIVAGSTVPAWNHVLVAAVIGAAAGILAGVTSLGRLRGSSVPYSLAFALGLFKGPCGALSAILGVLLIRAGLPGGDLGTNTTAGLVGWVVVFGASQQLVTRLADQKGQSVLEGVTSGTGNKPRARKDGSGS